MDCSALPVVASSALLTSFSGGHTAELIAMLSALPPERYTPRTYFISAGDMHSRGKAAALETRLGGSAHVVTLPRARAVKQSFLSAPASTVVALAGCMQAIVLPQLCAGRRRVGPEMLLMNGPGTCVPLVASVYVLRVSGRLRGVARTRGAERRGREQREMLEETPGQRRDTSLAMAAQREVDVARMSRRGM
jgi:hypothetical protein